MIDKRKGDSTDSLIKLILKQIVSLSTEDAEICLAHCALEKIPAFIANECPFFQVSMMKQVSGQKDPRYSTRRGEENEAHVFTINLYISSSIVGSMIY